MVKLLPGDVICRLNGWVPLLLNMTEPCVMITNHQAGVSVNVRSLSVTAVSACLVT
jgi:hypothetical protein